MMKYIVLCLLAMSSVASAGQFVGHRSRYRNHHRPGYRRRQPRFVPGRHAGMYQQAKARQAEQQIKARQADRQQQYMNANSFVPNTRALVGGRRGETVTDVEGGGYRIFIPGHRKERFDVRLEGSDYLVVQSLSPHHYYRGYKRRLEVPANADVGKITVTHLRRSGMHIDIPVVRSEPEDRRDTLLNFEESKEMHSILPDDLHDSFGYKSAGFEAGDNHMHSSGMHISAKDTYQSRLNRLNRGWSDPEGQLLERYEFDTDILVMDVAHVVDYPKAADAVDGFMSPRGNWQRY